MPNTDLNKSSIARIAGNVASGMMPQVTGDVYTGLSKDQARRIAKDSVLVARAIAEELENHATV